MNELYPKESHRLVPEKQVKHKKRYGTFSVIRTGLRRNLTVVSSSKRSIRREHLYRRTFIRPKTSSFTCLRGRSICISMAHGRRLRAGDLVRMPKGLPHAYYNRQDKPARALFSVSPARRLRELFDQLHNLTDPGEVVRRSKICEVDFLPPGSVPGA